MTECNTVPVITVDGPSGSGKGTISRLISKSLSWHFLDSGALYRLLGLYAQKNGIAVDDESKLAQLGLDLSIQFFLDTTTNNTKILLKNQDVTQDIRNEKIGKIASKIAAFPRVREALLVKQRAFAKAPGLVADGRDMGTVVFPQAPVKIYLDASVEERAHRRYVELKNKGMNVNLIDTLAELKSRDERDMKRAVAPLMPAEDAVVVDTTHMGIQEVLDRVLEIITKQLPKAQ